MRKQPLTLSAILTALLAMTALFLAACEKEEPAGPAPGTTAKQARPEPSPPPLPAEIPPQRPDVLLVTVSGLRADAVGALNERSDLTPHLDALAEGGALFENTVAQSTHSRASLASLLTSTWPSRNGVLGNTPEDKLPAYLPTMAEVLKAVGYETWAFSTNSNMTADLGFARGYDTFHHRFEWAPLVNAELTGWLDQRPPSETPFYAHVHYNDIQTWYLNSELDPRAITPPRQLFLEAPDDPLRHSMTAALAQYRFKVQQVDEAIGELVAYLDNRTDGDRDTLIIVAADHGEELLDHGGFWHGFTVYPEVARVPLVVHHPLWQGRRVATPVELMDLMPTLLDLMGEAAPEDVQGQTLLPHLAGQAEAQGWHTYAFTESSYDDFVAGYRTETLSYIVNLDEGTEAMADLTEDPYFRRSRTSESEFQGVLKNHLEENFEAQRREAVEGTELSNERWEKIAEKVRAIGSVAGQESDEADRVPGSLTAADLTIPRWVPALTRDEPIWTRYMAGVDVIARGDERLVYEAERWQELDNYPNLKNWGDRGAPIVVQAEFTDALLVFYAHAWSGIAEIQVDGQTVQTVDLFRPKDEQAGQHLVPLTGLEDREHVVVIRPTGNRNERAEGKELLFQAVLLLE